MVWVAFACKGGDIVSKFYSFRTMMPLRMISYTSIAPWRV